MGREETKEEKSLLLISTVHHTNSTVVCTFLNHSHQYSCQHFLNQIQHISHTSGDSVRTYSEDIVFVMWDILILNLNLILSSPTPTL